MAQLYYADSGMLIEEGLSKAQYRALPDFSNAIHNLSDTGQLFPNRLAGGELWFYIPGKDKFFLHTRNKHAYEAALEEILGLDRWQEVKDLLEEQGSLDVCFAQLDLRKIKRKIKKLQNKNLITAAEFSSLITILPENGTK